MQALSTLLAADSVVDIKTNLTTNTSFPQFFDIGAIVSNLASTVLAVGALAAFAYLVLGAFNWTISGGDKEKVHTAQQMITQGIIGLGLLAATFAVFAIIQYVLGIDIVKMHG